ncbi:hypothetical protein T4A_8925 [Trichinella pseudospiralis]|uniref:Uncharacterized protein n=1 Tax=Trichinella pseudospiralis TaxID=6337 RepID=A0A0V1DSN2_TRIPS|nr:hypothetical protein T4A_8925 [Trichinella pseudospiralis]
MKRVILCRTLTVQTTLKLYQRLPEVLGLKLLLEIIVNWCP